ncbi:hypothetical protein KO506_03425 [Polaribacter vadi]|uniref:hypothetical protein n=1 Tax=Polaribacter TaxID=52959 RepID=UPI001C0994C9|nr:MULTISPECIES: hypothetical protein [Polaribacter]MBU3010438.1 hypothetical protein [Polaribacter vadi]MDO6740246.1 hypothetical protein [Polaribacter sp. 1_MG-2023]
MSKLAIKSKKIIFNVSNLEKKHKIITYASLLFLTVSTYFLRSENQTVKIEYATLQEKSHNLKQNMIIFNGDYEDFPLPVWQKVKRGDKFILQYVNKAFIECFGHSFDYNRYNIIGKTNFESFNKNMAQQYYEADIAVSVTGEKLHSKPEYIDKENKIHRMKVLKWREVVNNKDTLIYGIVKEITK